MASDPPKVLISYSHDSPEHKDRVLVLSNRLRGEGIDCTIDQYLLVPPEGWPRWMEKQIRESDFVLMVCTETITGASWASPIPTEGGARVFYSPPLWLQSSETKEGRSYGNPRSTYRKSHRRHSRSLWFIFGLFRPQPRG
jgi:hypothetical protein